jgi:hypothetical protein
MMVIVVAVAIYAGDGVSLRCAGVNTTSGQAYQLVCDSTDTFQVDTFYSDTFKFENYPGYWDYNYAIITLIRDTVVLADSGNDSVVVAQTVWTRDDAGYAIQLATDAPAKDLTNDTVQLRFYINSSGTVPNADSTVRDWIWVRTIVSDSFIQGAGYDTTLYKARYYLWFCK